MKLEVFIEEEIIPRYAAFDAAHREDHVRTVIRQALEIAAMVRARADGGKDRWGRPVEDRILLAAAAYHDLGIVEGREVHHIASGRIIRSDERLREWFSDEEIEEIAQAAEDHRASGKGEPRSIYGLILAEADREIFPRTIVRRTVQYGIDHYPELDREGHWQRTLEHLREKYGDGGYLRLWIPESDNAARLESLRQMIRQQENAEGETELRDWFDRAYQRQRTLDFLDAHGIRYNMIEHPPLFTIEEAMEYWKDIDDCVHCKNLFMRNHKGNRHYLISFACWKDFDIHSLEKVLHQGKLSFGSPERMMRCLGLKPGSVSPLGLINDIGLPAAGSKELFENGHRVKLYLDSDLKQAANVSFHPCDNTASLIIPTEDFLKYLEIWGGEVEWTDVTC